jgi:protein-S-isoprenylcysteine O-methyltransferase Ste14
MGGYSSANNSQPGRGSVITLGVILLIIGFIAKIAILWTIGIILVVIGLILAVLGMMGRAVGGRAHYY